MVLDPIPQSLPVHFFGSRPQPPTSQRRLWAYISPSLYILWYDVRAVHVQGIPNLAVKFDKFSISLIGQSCKLTPSHMQIPNLHIRTYTCMYIYMYTYTFICTFMYTYTYICIHICMCTTLFRQRSCSDHQYPQYQKNSSVYMYLSIFTLVNIYLVYIYISYIYIHIYVYIYICM